MGCETDLFCGIVFDNKTYKTRYDVEVDIEFEKRLIDGAKQRLHELAVMTEPQKFLPDEEESGDYLSIVHSEVDEQLEQLEESIVSKANLEMLLEKWDCCHTEDDKPIYPPEDMSVWDTAYICGDYIGYSDKDNKSKQKEL